MDTCWASLMIPVAVCGRVPCDSVHLVRAMAAATSRTYVADADEIAGKADHMAGVCCAPCTRCGGTCIEERFRRRVRCGSGGRRKMSRRIAARDHRLVHDAQGPAIRAVCQLVPRALHERGWGQRHAGGCALYRRGRSTRCGPRVHDGAVDRGCAAGDGDNPGVHSWQSARSMSDHAHEP